MLPPQVTIDYYFVCRQPSVLTYSNKLMQERIDFLKESGFASDAVAKAAIAHPQVRHLATPCI